MVDAMGIGVKAEDHGDLATWFVQRSMNHFPFAPDF
jgi:hypothetical protein